MLHDLNFQLLQLTRLHIQHRLPQQLLVTDVPVRLPAIPKMAEPQGSYAAEFTSMGKDSSCDICGQKAKLKYMHHKNPAKLGRHLCPSCYERYLNKAGTARRSSGTVSLTSDHRQVIHKQIAKAQRGCESYTLDATFLHS